MKKWSKRFSLLCLTLIWVLVAGTAEAGSTGWGWCTKCGKDVDLSKHDQSHFGPGSESGGRPSGPTPEELEEAWVEQDLREAADDAVDTAIEFYEKGDWENAIKYFKEALEYVEDDGVILDNLQLAEDKLAGDQLKSIVKHSLDVDKLSKEGTIYNNKLEEASEEAQKGFDDFRNYAGSFDPIELDGRNPFKEPIIPREKRTKTIVKLEKQRDEVKKKRIELENNILKIENKAQKTPEETVKLAKLKQELSPTRNEEIFLNFSISEELKKPTKTDTQGKE